MSQSEIQPTDGESTTQPAPPPASNAPQPRHITPKSLLAPLNSFLQHVRPSLLKFDEFTLNHWYLYLIAFYLILLADSLIADVHNGLLYYSDPLIYFGQFYNDSFTKDNVLNWGYNISVLGGFLILALFNQWRKNIPEFFQALKSKIRTDSDEQDTEQKFQQFLELYERSLTSGVRYLLTGITLLILAFVLFAWWRGQVIYLAYIAMYNRFNAFTEGATNIVRETLYSALEVYLVVTITWIMSVTGLYIRRFTTRFELIIQPGHPDQSGGLKALGDFCLSMALVILLGGIVFVYYGIFKGASLWTTATNIMLILFIFPLSYLAFFVPVWTIHRKMLVRKRAYEDEYANRVAKLEEKILSSLDKGEVDRAKAAKEEIEIMQILHPDKIGYPEWPFTRDVFLKFLTPQIIAVLSLLIQLGPVLDFLRRIFARIGQ